MARLFFVFVLALLSAGCTGGVSNNEATPDISRFPDEGTLQVRSPNRDLVIKFKSKVESSLAGEVLAQPDKEYRVVVQFFKRLTPEEEAELEQYFTVNDYSYGPVNFGEGSIPGTLLGNILELDFVKWVEPAIEGELGGG